MQFICSIFTAHDMRNNPGHFIYIPIFEFGLSRDKILNRHGNKNFTCEISTSENLL